VSILHWLRNLARKNERKLQAQKAIEPPPYKPIRIREVSDYLKLSGFHVEITLAWVDNTLSQETVSGIVRDLSDNCQYLILTNAKRYSAKSPPSDIGIIKIPLSQIKVIEVIDRFMGVKPEGFSGSMSCLPSNTLEPQPAKNADMVPLKDKDSDTPTTGTMKQNNGMEEMLRSLEAVHEAVQKGKVEQLEARLEAAAAHGMLPSPEIDAYYDCECGAKNRFSFMDLDLKGGLDLLCIKCGAVLRVPPTVIDHTKYWSIGKGASLAENWRDQLRFVKHAAGTLPPPRLIRETAEIPYSPVELLISDLPHLHDAIMRPALAVMVHESINPIKYVNENIVLDCPVCGVRYNEQGFELGYLASLFNMGIHNVTFTGGPTGVYARTSQGLCLNSNCTSKLVIAQWKGRSL